MSCFLKRKIPEDSGLHLLSHCLGETVQIWGLWVITLCLLLWVEWVYVGACVYVSCCLMRWDFGQGFRAVVHSPTTLNLCGYQSKLNQSKYFVCALLCYLSSYFVSFPLFCDQTKKFFILLSDQNLGCPAKPHFIPEYNQSGVPFPLCGISLSLSVDGVSSVTLLHHPFHPNA